MVIAYSSTKSHSNIYPSFDSMMSMILNCMISHVFIVWVKQIIGAYLLGEIVGVYAFMLVVFKMAVSFVIVMVNL